MPLMSKRIRPRPKPPSPEQIRDRRLAAGLTQSQAAALVYVETQGWRRYESGTASPRPAIWRLFCLRVEAGEFAPREAGPTPSPVVIRRKREAGGLTQLQAADTVGVSLQSWQRYESGEHAPNAAVWALFCALSERRAL